MLLTSLKIIAGLSALVVVSVVLFAIVGGIVTFIGEIKNRNGY